MGVGGGKWDPVILGWLEVMWALGFVLEKERTDGLVSREQTNGSGAEANLADIQ